MVVLFKLSILIIVLLGFAQFFIIDAIFYKKKWYQKFKKYVFWLDIILVACILISITLLMIFT